MEIQESVQVTPGLKNLFDRLDETLPTGLKTGDFFRATTHNLTALFEAAGSVGIDAQELIGETLKITITINPTTTDEEAYLKFKSLETTSDHDCKICTCGGTCHEE
ncbi:hypothetical protein SDC9_20419 [bioreactor metagenome]|uniref:Uncharacterized protein n=1 Tax=bioreactor metagenome TaxID=1076179 RepID=A0A644U6N7_9ZZZZ|nr:hypothetical protein [Methanocorpusculum sp.]